MATSSKREVELVIGVETTGQQSVKALSDAVSNLAKEGGEAAPEFQKLARELDRVAQQQDAVSSFARLKRELADTAVSLNEAAARVDEIGARLPEAAAATDTFSAAQREAKAALDANKTLLKEAQDSLKALNGEYDRAGKKTDEYRIAAGELGATIKTLKTNSEGLTEEYKASQAATKEVVKYERELVGAYNQAETAAKALSGEFGRQNTALDAARGALQAAGVESTELGAIQQNLRSQFASVRGEIEQSVTAYQRMQVSQAAAARAASEYAAEESRLAAVLAKTQAEMLKRGQDDLSGELANQREAIELEQRLATERKNAAAARASQTQRSIADAQSLLDTELALERASKEYASTVNRQTAALSAAERATIQLAEAEKLLQSELEIESASKREAIALEQQRTKAAQDSARALRTAAAESAAALEAAFAKTGVKSAQALEREIADINEALNRLAFNARVSGADFDKAFAAGQERIGKLRNEIAGAPEEINKTAGATGYLKQQFSQLAAIYGGIELARAFIDANVQLETMRRSLAVVTGSTQTAAAQIDFLRNTANKAGISVSGISDAFVRFNASAVTAGIKTETVNKVFSAVALAGGKMGLSTERVALSLEALGQIASKGTVSMEELRGQLGDSFPGALSIASKALGVTQSDLVKLVESGQVLAEDFLPAFGEAVKREFGGAGGAVEGFAATWGRLKNVMQTAFTTIGDTGAMDALGYSLKVVGAAAGTLALGVSVAFETLFVSLKSLATLISGIAEGDIKGAFARIGAMTDDAVARQAKFASALQNLAGFGDEVADSQNTAAAAIGNTGTVAQSAAAGHTANAQAHQQTAVSAGQNAVAQTAAGTAAAVSGQQAAGASAGWYQLGVEYEKAKIQAEGHTQATIKQTEADKLRGDLMVRVAELSRDEVRVQTEASAAAEAYALSVAKVAAARQAEVAIVEKQIAAVTAENTARGGNVKGLQDQLVALQQLLDKKTAEAAKSIESAAAAKQESAERQVAAQTYKDNADRLGELGAAARDARATLAALIALEKEGYVTSKQVTAARTEEAKAMALYADAIKDVAARTAALTAVQKAEASQVQANLSVEMARAKASESFGKTYENEALQRSAQIDQRRIEIKMINATRDSIIQEQQAIISKAASDRAELELAGPMNETKRLEIEARIKAAEAKKTEAEAGRGKITEIENEISAILRQGQTQSSVSQSNIGAIESEIQSRQRNIDKIEAEQAAADAKASYDRTHTAGDNTGSFLVRDKLAAGTLTSDDAALVKGVYEAARANLDQMQKAAPGTFSFAGARDVESTYQMARRAYEKVVAPKGLNNGATPTSAALGGSSGRTVNISLNGSTTTVKVQSDADSRNMEALLKQLANSSQTAN